MAEADDDQERGAGQADLLARARAGDPSALEELLERNAARLKGRLDQRLGRALRGKLRPSDILQSTYLKVLGSISEFEGATESDFANWIVHILENTIRGRARHFGAQKRDARRERLAEVELIQRPVAEPTPSQEVAAGEELQRIARAMSRLPRDYVRILTLHMDAERSHKESARLMGRSEGASRVLLARARAALLLELRGKEGKHGE